MDMCVDMCVDMCIGMCMDMCIHVCMNMCIHMCIDICADMCMDMRIDMYADMCIDMCIDMCKDMCIGMCKDMCIDMCINMCVCVCIFFVRGLSSNLKDHWACVVVAWGFTILSCTLVHTSALSAIQINLERCGFFFALPDSNTSPRATNQCFWGNVAASRICMTQATDWLRQIMTNDYFQALTDMLHRHASRHVCGEAIGSNPSRSLASFSRLTSSASLSGGFRHTCAVCIFSDRNRISVVKKNGQEDARLEAVGTGTTF